MSDVDDLRTRLVGQRFYDREQDEAFTVVGFTEAPALALLQYDDGVAWDEGATHFTVDDDVAYLAALEKHGLDSDRYRSLGPGPCLDEICDPDAHEWYPKPEDIWPGGPPEDVRERLAAPPRDIYNRFVRCKRCGHSGDVAGQFGMYGSSPGDSHATPWFCTDCGDAYPGTTLVYRGDFPYCPDCAAKLDESETTD